MLVSERLAEAADRAVPGHWEGDLLLGRGRKSQTPRFLTQELIRAPRVAAESRVAVTVRDAVAAKIIELPDQLRLRQSLIWA